MTSRNRLLIVDDDAPTLASYVSVFVQNIDEFIVDTEETPEGCLKRLKQEDYQMIILDVSFTPGNLEGIDLVPKIIARQPDAFVVMVSSHDNTEVKKRALAAGAKNFVSKTVHDMQAIAERFKTLVTARARERDQIRRGLELANQTGAVAVSTKMQSVYAQVVRAKDARLPVLILGETGVGKEKIAEAISKSSEGRPFVKLNCAAFSESLLNNELFGHERGAYTGADRQHKGAFERAHGGDIFLDEVACLSPQAQAALLRVLQTKEVSRLGSELTRKLDFRVVCATNEDLSDKVKAGTFRQDLMERINHVIIRIPPLRERPEDIQPIAEFILARNGRQDLKFDPEVLVDMLSYPWPGNIRELESEIEKISNYALGPFITYGDLSEELRSRMGRAMDSDSSTSMANVTNEILIKVPAVANFDDGVRAFKKQFVDAWRKKLGPKGNDTALAAVIGVTRQTIYNIDNGK